MITWGKSFDLSKIFSQLHVIVKRKCMEISLENLYVDLGIKCLKCKVSPSLNKIILVY